MEPSTRFKLATTPAEFEQIHRLNYRTFVEEIPQHAPNPDGRHVDKFHADNTYLIGVRDARVIAQIALRRRRPFSLDTKLPDLDRHLPPGRRLVEVRLLAVDPAHRNGPVPAQLLRFAARHCHARGDDLAVISGAVRRQRLYRAMGFEPFGPIVGTDEAPYQPMFLTLEKFTHATLTRPSLRHGLAPAAETDAPHPPVNLLPGPVAVSPVVLAAFAQPPTSHRAPAFVDQVTHLRRRLAALTRAGDVQILPGSGTLANDIVAAQLAALPGPGLIVSTGEFGERLADHARRARLDFHWTRLPWGTPLTPAVLADAFGAAPAPRWLWLVHHETSTGVLHDLELLKSFARAHHLALCLDCMSSIGAVAVDLSGVHLATASSNKGLAALPGLALVFHQDPPQPRADLPRYLDLALWAAANSVPFTHSSNLIAALDVALAEIERLPSSGRCTVDDSGAWLRAELTAAGFTVVASEPHASPIIVTVQLPPSLNSTAVGAHLERRGFLASHQSAYLTARNWIQFCLIGAPARATLAALVAELRPFAVATTGTGLL